MLPQVNGYIGVQETDEVNGLKNMLGMYSELLKNECLRFNEYQRKEQMNNVIYTNGKFSQLMDEVNMGINGRAKKEQITV